MLMSSGQQPFGDHSGPDIALGEAFCKRNTALQASVLGTGLDKVGEVDVVMIPHPLELALMTFQHLDFCIDHVRNIDIFGGDKTDTCQRIHIVDIQIIILF